jgi:LPS-assembly protein
VSYYQTTARLVAVGNVRFVDANGTVYEANQLDITDDFRNGFIEQLYVVTTDRTFITADAARRSDGRITEFFNATYTACEVRLNHEERPPLWQIRAATVVHNEETQTIHFEDARFEVAGVPIAYVPRLKTPDPSVTRATGFLAPEASLSSSLGFGVGIPFFWALAPNFDLTLTPTYYTGTGLMTEAEWRHHVQSGIYTVTAAAIYEKAPVPADRMFRGAIRTTGAFDINRFWRFGWDGTVQTDRSFAAEYRTVNPSTPFVRSEAFLTGVINRTYFDANAYYFRDTRDAADPRHEQTRQAAVHPVVDIEHIFNPRLAGGQVTFTANATVISRDADDPFTVGPDTFYYGLAGSTARLTQQLLWQRQMIGARGQVFTPFAFARADLFVLDLDAPPPGVTADPFAARATAGIGLEWAWPLLVQTPNGRHIIEPVVQLVARPSEAMIGALPNDDAQSVIFDTTSLLALNRFSGFDRTEGGTRLVVMLRYNGRFGGTAVEAIVGQSYQLAGVNSYAVPGVNQPATGTGLETARSDVVSALRVSTDVWSIDAAGRFDSTSLELQRGTLTASADVGPFSASTGIAFERAILDLEGMPQPMFLVTGEAALELGDYWTLLASIDYDAIGGAVVANSIGLKYECDCAAMTITYSEDRDLGVVTDRSIMFGLQLRTLGDFNLGR